MSDVLQEWFAAARLLANQWNLCEIQMRRVQVAMKRERKASRNVRAKA